MHIAVDNGMEKRGGGGEEEKRGSLATIIAMVKGRNTGGNITEKAPLSSLRPHLLQWKGGKGFELSIFYQELMSQ